MKRHPPARQLSYQKGALSPPAAATSFWGAGFRRYIAAALTTPESTKMMISERYRRVDVIATRQEDHTWLARAGDMQLPFRYPTAEDALREARAHVDGARGWHAKNH